jgi:hypothetical protein
VLLAGGCGGVLDGGAKTKVAPASVAVGGTYTLVRAGSGKCLDVQGAGSANFTRIQQYSCNGTGAQLFRVDDIGGGNVRLVNPESNKCVDINGAGTTNGTQVQLYDCNGTGAQSYVLQDRGNGLTSLMNPHSGKCVDVSGASNADSANVQLWDCNGTVAQQWNFTAAGGSSGGGSGGGGGGGSCDPNAWVFMGNDPNACAGHVGESCGWTGATAGRAITARR